MTHTVVYYKVARDNTGIHEEIPVILTEFGPLHPLIHYILKHRHMLSGNTSKLVRAVGLLDRLHGGQSRPSTTRTTCSTPSRSGSIAAQSVSTATTPATCTGMPVHRPWCACW